MFAKTVSSRGAATEPTEMYSRRVLANMSVYCTRLPHMVLGVAEFGTDIVATRVKVLDAAVCGARSVPYDLGHLHAYIRFSGRTAGVLIAPRAEYCGT